MAATAATTPDTTNASLFPTLVLLGATGDLAQRFLFPALGSLATAGRLPVGFRVVAGAQRVLDDAGVRRLAGDALPADAVTYRQVDVADPSSLSAMLDGTRDAVAVYLALPPAVFATTIRSLGEAGLPDGSRIVIEKPFGDDFESARALNAMLARTGHDIYRVDHVLGMETTQNLVAIRGGNPVLERVWNGESVERVDILWEETLALEGRAGYYDHAGALKDVLQNHMLQLLALVGLDAGGDRGELQEKKLAVLRSVRVAAGGSRRARYTAGTVADGREVGAYADEVGVDPTRRTETFAEVALGLDTPRWAGTRFVLRAGKALSQRRKLVRLCFRGGGGLEVGIDGPVDVVLRLRGAASAPFELCGRWRGSGLPPYAHVLLDVLGGTHALAVGGDEAEEAWRVVAPVLTAWQAGDVPLEEYRAGSSGPSG
jgi:glucose-6-phosphate 1-dehydrogenase